MDDKDKRAGRAQFIAGSLQGLLKMANEDRADMLAYLLEMALMEAALVERQARAGE